MCHTGRSKKTCTASSDASIEQEMWGHGWLKRAIWMSESACLIFKKKYEEEINIKEKEGREREWETHSDISQIVYNAIISILW